MPTLPPAPAIQLAKRPRTPQRVPEACPACHAENRFVARTATGDFDYRGTTVRVTYDRFACPDCGFAVMNESQFEARHRRIREQALAQP